MNLTTNIGLQKPISNEKYNVAVQNANMDIIDSAINRLQNKDASQDELLATKEYVNETVKNATVDLDGYATESYVDSALINKADKTELFSGSYNDLTDKPTIPDAYDDTQIKELIETKVSNTTTVNGKALSSNISLNASDVGADASGTATSAISTHNTATDAHNDIRLLITELTTRLNTLANSTDEDLDQMAEIVEYIKSNKELIDSITTSKVSVTDIINNLTTNVSDKPLSAAQGVVIKALIDTLQTEVDGKAESSDIHTHSNKTVLDGITSTLVSNWNSAKTHADSTHAPSNAEENVIETVKVNGTALTPSSKAVNIKVPTKISDLTNDSISVSQSLTSGTQIGTITINETETKLYAPTDTDTHYTSKNVVGSPTATNNTNSALSNGNVYLNSVENGAVTSSHKIMGSGTTTVTTDASGNIIINSTDENSGTTYTAGTGLELDGTTINHSNSVTAGTASGGSGVLSHGGTFTTPTVTYDAQGHVTSKGTKTYTLPDETSLSVTSSGSGNAVTGITVSGHDITTIKGSTFLTSHPTIDVSTDTTSTASPSHGGTVTMIDSITRDSNGHVTKVNTKTVTLPSDNNTDTKVKQTATTTNASYPLLLAPSGQTETSTTTSYFDSGVTLNPSTNTIEANVSGSAGSATKATQDASGNTITTSYAASASISDTNLLLKSKSGATLSTVDLSGLSGGSGITYSDTEPTTLTDGMTWIGE